MMMNPIAFLIGQVIHLIQMALTVWIILGLLIQFKIVNRYQPLVFKLETALNRLFEPMLRPIRKFMPDLGGIDLSPVVLIIGLNFIAYSVNYIFAMMGI
jgi:YggT family protein